MRRCLAPHLQLLKFDFWWGLLLLHYLYDFKEVWVFTTFFSLVCQPSTWLLVRGPSLSLWELVDIEHSLMGQKIILMGQLLTAFEILMTKHSLMGQRSYWWDSFWHHLRCRVDLAIKPFHGSWSRGKLTTWVLTTWQLTTWRASVCEQTLEHFCIGQSESQQYLCEPFLVTQCGCWLDLLSTDFAVDVPGADTMQFAPVTSLWLHWTYSAEWLVGVSIQVH